MQNIELESGTRVSGALGALARGRSLTRLACAIAGASLVAALSLGSLGVSLSVLSGTSEASSDDSRGGAAGDGVDDFATGDNEYGGTLPMVGEGGDDEEALAQLLPTAGPSFYIQAPAPELLGAILSAGPGALGEGSFITYELIPTQRDGQSNLRLTFHGAVELTFDSSLLAVDGVQCGLSLGASVDSYRAALIYGDRVLSNNALSGQDSFSVPFAALHERNLLGKVQLLTSDGKRVRTVIDIDEIGGLISVGQDVLGHSRH